MYSKQRTVTANGSFRQFFFFLQSQNIDYRTYKTTLKVLVKCNYYANITSIMTYKSSKALVEYDGRRQACNSGRAGRTAQQLADRPNVVLSSACGGCRRRLSVVCGRCQRLVFHWH